MTDVLSGRAVPDELLTSVETVTKAAECVVEQWGRIDYSSAMQRLEKAHVARLAGIGPDSIFYLEHDPVYTFGRATEPGDLAGAVSDVPKVEVPRGGLATYHGPGQLVGYIVLDLKKGVGRERPDIHRYLRALEEGLIAFVESEYDLPCHRREGFTGVWTHGFSGGSGHGRKLASIGVSVRRWVTSHGFALNLEPDLRAFHSIVPCGIRDAEITSVAEEFNRISGPTPSFLITEVASRVHPHLLGALHRQGVIGS